MTVQARSATITLAKRKNHRASIDLTRECCCPTSGQALCAIHRIQQLREGVGTSGELFGIKLYSFRARIRSLAQQVGVKDWAHVGTHSFRRGMAQDIVDAGSPLGVLLRAGGWSSSAYLEYLREGQCTEAAADSHLDVRPRGGFVSGPSGYVVLPANFQWLMDVEDTTLRRCSQVTGSRVVL